MVRDRTALFKRERSPLFFCREDPAIRACVERVRGGGVCGSAPGALVPTPSKMEPTFQEVLVSLREHVARILTGEIDEVRIKRKPSGKIHITTSTEESHEAHEAPRGEEAHSDLTTRMRRMDPP